MLKISIAAAVSFVALSMAPVPLITGQALAQAACTAAPCKPPTTSGGESSTYTCGNELGMLRRVYEEELEVIDNPLNVAVVPVCTGEDYGVMRSDGNAGALRQVIAQNDAMTDALDLKNFGSDDVVGIRMTSEDKVILYVHEFHHR
jgi:hypothetical protein